MDRISELSDEILVKILSFVPTKEAVSTSALSKRWEFLWMWVPKLKFLMNHSGSSDLPLRDFITKNLPLLKPQVIETFHLECSPSSFQPEDIKHWVGTTISRGVGELFINYDDGSFKYESAVCLPSSLYTCKSLVTLILKGYAILVDVPGTVCLPSLKTLELDCLEYVKEDSIRLLLSYCPVLEDLVIDRETDDNLKTIVINVPSLLRLTLPINGASPCEGYEIVTPSLKYFRVQRIYRDAFSDLSMHMPKVEEADLCVDEDVELLFESIACVKRLSLSVKLDCKDKFMYHNGIVFHQLEYLELDICNNWSKAVFRLLKDSPKLRVLKLSVEFDPWFKKEDKHAIWTNNRKSSVPKCLLDSLETFEFVGYTKRPEEREFVSYILKHACHLKSPSISFTSSIFDDEDI